MLKVCYFEIKITIKKFVLMMFVENNRIVVKKY